MNGMALLQIQWLLKAQSPERISVRALSCLVGLIVAGL